MREPYRPKEPEEPRRRLLVILVGVAVTAAIAAALVWSVTQWPHACARQLDLPVDAVIDSLPLP